MSDATEAFEPDARRSTLRLPTFFRNYATPLAIGTVVFLVGYDNGGFSEPTRDTLTIVLWWLVILGIGLGIWPLARTPLPALVTGLLLLGFSLFTLLSTAWASDAGGAYAEFTRVGLYLAVFTLAVIAASRANAEGWVAGLALGIVAIAVLALLSRFFPHTFPGGNAQVIRFLSGARTRLYYPVGYWNGLAILVALAIPLLLRSAVAARNALARGLAIVPIPAIAGVIYLASSRTGVVAAFVGTVAFVVLTPRRWAAFVSVLLAGAGSAFAVWALYSRNQLVNGPLHSPTAISQGRSAALILLGICVLTGLVYGLASGALSDRLKPSPVLGWAVAVCAVALVVVGIAAAHPVRRFHDFKQLPAAQSSGSAIQSHLLSKSGNGRWQLWKAAWKEFEKSPLHGRGAGSYGQWWLQHGSLAGFTEEAHSLYLETLGELGIVGFVLLAATFIAGIAAAVSRLWRTQLDQRATLAAATGAFLAYAVAAAADWMWELSIVSVIAFACLGLMTGPATEPVAAPRVAEAEPAGGHRQRSLARYGLGIAVILGGWLLICATAVPLLAGSKLRDSQNAAGQGNATTAIRDAMDAKSIQPWSSAPYLQLALVTEQAGRLRLSRSWIKKAIARSPDNWQLWLIRARLETKLGNVREAKRSLARVKALNPRSPLFGTT